jgi:PleD family two-component response regulator
MLPGKTYAEAGQVLKRIRITMASSVVSLNDRELAIQFRHGIAELKANESAQELLARARQGIAAPAASGQPVDAKRRPAGSP